MSILDHASCVALTIGDEFIEMPVPMLRYVEATIRSRDGSRPSNREILAFLEDCEDIESSITPPSQIPVFSWIEKY